jgi:cytochrome d ubiquinol oxidase subunit II
VKAVAFEDTRSGIGVLAVVWGWGIAQYPVVLPKTTLTLDNSAASHETLVGIAVVFALTVLLVGPAFLILFRLYGREALRQEDAR